ncbi:MAG: hypothetical protein ACPGSG_11405 [Prolixibacteraceae bacterium]
MKQTLKDLLFAVCLISGFFFLFYLVKQGYQMQLMFQIMGALCGVLFVLIMVIYDRDRPYYDFLKLWFEFHVREMHREPKPKAFYEQMIRSHDKLYLLEKTEPTGLEKKKIEWKKQLIEAILDASGLFKYKATGKQNHKMRYKFWKDGQMIKVKGR